MSEDAKEKAIDRARKAHDELASALKALSKDHAHTPRAARAIAVSLTHAETSFLWFRSSVQD